MADFDVELIDNSREILAELSRNMAAAYEAVGQAMQTHVQEGCPVGTPESTSIQNYHGGRLRQSITHKVVEGEVYVGTNMRADNGAPYPIYVEFGTGIYATDGNGRKSPWIWRDINGKYHHTRGIKPTHFMRNAVSSAAHVAEYKEIIKNQLKNG